MRGRHIVHSKLNRYRVILALLSLLLLIYLVNRGTFGERLNREMFITGLNLSEMTLEVNGRNLNSVSNAFNGVQDKTTFPQLSDSSIESLSQEMFLTDGPVDESCMEECHQYMQDSIGSDLTLCNLHAESRGPGQMIVSFSFYGELKSAYYNGISENLKNIQVYYPDWTMRLYLDPTTVDQNSTEELCSLSCSSNRLDLCSVKNLPRFGDISKKFGMVWRFVPMADPLVDIFVSRDLDSRFSERESAAVGDWISTDLPFHAMRDNPYHGTPILGGMWGARTDLGNREKYAQLIEEMITKMSNSWGKGLDQTLLSQYIWPSVKKEACVHDSYTCKTYPAPHNRPWPTRRKEEPGNFVGAIGDMQISMTCPKECRPKEHEDWTTC